MRAEKAGGTGRLAVRQDACQERESDMNVKLYMKFITTYMKSKMEYRSAFLLELAANTVMVFGYYAGTWIIFQNFSSVQSWSYHEILFLFNINWLCYSISGFFLWGPMITLGQIVQSGEFDSILIRPLRPLSYLVFRQFQYTFFPRLILAVVFLGISLDRVKLEWTGGKIVFVLVTLLSGIIIHAGLLVMIGASSFYTIRNDEIGKLYTDNQSGLRTFADYPLTIYNKPVKFLLTFLAPYGFVSYYPCLYILNKEGGSMDVLKYMSPFAAAGVTVAAAFIWRKGIGRYNSTGT